MLLNFFPDYHRYVSSEHSFAVLFCNISGNKCYTIVCVTGGMPLIKMFVLVNGRDPFFIHYTDIL